MSFLLVSLLGLAACGEESTSPSQPRSTRTLCEAACDTCRADDQTLSAEARAASCEICAQCEAAGPADPPPPDDERDICATRAHCPRMD